MTQLNTDARQLLESAALAHLVTINPDGSPQVSVVWTGLDGDEIVVGHLGHGQKLRNIEHDGRVAITFEGPGTTGPGLANYLTIYGCARITAGGAPELLQSLAVTYLGPGIKFPPFDDPAPGHVIHIAIERITGVGPWAK